MTVPETRLEQPVVVHTADLDRQHRDDPEQGRLTLRQLLEPAPAAQRPAASVMELGPGHCYRQPGYVASLYYVLCGAGILELDGQLPQPIEIGAAVYVPAGIVHTILNRQLRLLSLLAVDQAASAG